MTYIGTLTAPDSNSLAYQRVLIPSIASIKSIHDSGIFIDWDMSMLTHVINIASGCLAILSQLRSVRRAVSRPVMMSQVV